MAPAALELHVDPVRFGIVVITVPGIGMTPFIVQAAARVVTRGVMVPGTFPFIPADVLRLTLLVAFTALARCPLSQAF